MVVYVTGAVHKPTVLLTVILPGHTMVSGACTITVAVIGAPTQPLAVGVMVKVTVCAAVVVLTNVPVMLPVPDAAIPVTAAVLFLVQAKVVPGVVLVNTIGAIAALEQIVCVAGVATAIGVGFTVMVNVLGVPTQLTPLV